MKLNRHCAGSGSVGVGGGGGVKGSPIALNQTEEVPEGIEEATDCSPCDTILRVKETLASSDYIIFLSLNHFISFTL